MSHLWWKPAQWRRWTLALPALAILLPVGAMVVLGRFDGLYGQDPFAYYDYAVGPLRQSLLNLELPPPFFWPLGYPLLVALTSMIVGPVPLAGQLVSLMAGTLTPVFTALLAHEVWKPSVRGSGGVEEQGSGGAGEQGSRGDKGIREQGGKEALHHPFTPSPPHRLSSIPLHALVAGFLVAFTGQLWQSSAVIMADTTGLAAATLGVWALARYGRLASSSRWRLGWLLLAVMALAWATQTRWIYGLVAVPCAVYVLVVLRRHDVRTFLIHGGVAILMAGLILSPTLVPAVSSLLHGSADLAPFAGNFQVYSWHPLRAFQREFATVDGRLSYRLPNGLYYALAPAHPFYFTPLMAFLLLPGLWAAVRRRTAASLWLILGWPAMVYGFHAGAPWQNFRFTLAYLPPLAVLAGVGVETVRRGLRGRLRSLLGVYLAVGLIVMTVGGVRLTQSFIERKEAHLGIVRWVENQVPADSQILTFGLTLTLEHYSGFDVHDLFSPSAADLERLVAEGRPTYLLVEVDNLQQQWLGHAPERNYRWLKEGPGLVYLGDKSGYTLFRVKKEEAVSGVGAVPFTQITRPTLNCSVL